MSNTQYNELWPFLTAKSRHIETELDPLTRKRTGSYYTDLALTDVMMQELVEQLKATNTSKKLQEYRFLEPCVGAGNFVFSYIKAINANMLNKEEAQILLNNIYVADINKEALNGFKESLKQIALTLWNITLSEEYFDKHMGTGLLVDVTASKLNYIDIDEVFTSQIVEEGFDIIATNPPYKNLKAERGHYNTDEEYNKDKEKYSSISKIVSNHFKYSTDGVLNLYKLFVEEIINHYANKKAYVSLLIPASIMSDKTCMNLRTFMLKDNKILSVKVIREGSGFVDAHQALCAVLLQKGEATNAISVAKDYCKDPTDVAKVDIMDIINEYTGNAIVAVSSKEYQALKKLRAFPVVKELPFITNLRGELDLTENKKNIVKAVTKYPLLRGRNIGYYNLVYSMENEFVSEKFVNETKKKDYIAQERIICQQIANMNKERRVTFALAPKNCVLGNSCNFICVSSNLYGIDVYTLLGLFNTKIINWLFKLTSSNNHINNYEIDSFPVPITAPELKEISILAKSFLINKDDSTLNKIEQLATDAYGITL